MTCHRIGSIIAEVLRDNRKVRAIKMNFSKILKNFVFSLMAVCAFSLTRKRC